MDIQKIPPIHQKRIVTFMNYFIVDTVSFLNKFINSTEDSLWKMEKRMRKLETSLKLLEMKDFSNLNHLNTLVVQFIRKNNGHSCLKLLKIELNCIPDLPLTNPRNDDKTPVFEKSSTTAPSPVDQTEETNTENADQPEEMIPSEHQKYYKMYQVGVPLDAVKLKMKVEGFDPNLLKLP